jgi:hypothetical protein
MRYNLEDYETVEERIFRWYSDNPEGRIHTAEVTSAADRARGYWVVRAEVFEDHHDQHADCPKGVGHAFEIEGTSGANVTSSLENCETSAIGRALANAGYSSSKKGRASREEMEKVKRGPVQAAPVEVPEGFVESIRGESSIEKLKALWKTSVDGGFSDQVIEEVQNRKKELGNGEAKEA